MRGQKYDVKSPCLQCGDKTRYLATGGCVSCAKLKSRAIALARRKLGKLVTLPDASYPVGRADALLLKTRCYQPEMPCPHGHITLRDTATGVCLKCRRERLADRPPNPVLAEDRGRALIAARAHETCFMAVVGCEVCGTHRKYVRGLRCVGCAQAASASARRAPPTFAEARRAGEAARAQKKVQKQLDAAAAKAQKRLDAADVRLRKGREKQARRDADFAGELCFQSNVTCRRGHENPLRRTVDLQCLACWPVAEIPYGR